MDQLLKIETEWIDDLPVLLSQLEKMGIPELLDHHYPVHGNWQGLSLGQVVSVWLCHILSEGDHCLDHVRSWVNGRLFSLRSLVAPELTELDFTDDRLGLILSRLSDRAIWEQLETSLSNRILSVYSRNPSCIRHDSTTCSSFRSASESELGLFQFGPSKDHRPDLPQLKVMLATLDPMALPLSTQGVSGNCADDPLYLPSIQQVQKTLGVKSLLHVGDSKMASLETRAYLVFSGDGYLCPLSRKQFSEEQLRATIDEAFKDSLPLIEVERTDAKGITKGIALGFERSRYLTSEVQGIELGWQERLLIVRSLQHAKRSEHSFLQRLQMLQEELVALNQPKQGKSRPKSQEELESTIHQLVHSSKMETFLTITIEEIVTHKRLRAYKQRPATTGSQWDFQLTVTRNQEAIEQHIQYLGWQIYATPLLKNECSLAEAVLNYRNEYRVEQSFGRIKGPLSIRPMYLAKEDRIQGLVHLLSLALSLLSLVEFQLRQNLKKQHDSLEGLYPGNPKRATPQPSTEKLLQAFKEISLSLVQQPEQTIFYLNDLSPLQLKILHLMDLSPNCYYQLRGNFFNSS